MDCQFINEQNVGEWKETPRKLIYKPFKDTEVSIIPTE